MPRSPGRRRVGPDGQGAEGRRSLSRAPTAASSRLGPVGVGGRSGGEWRRPRPDSPPKVVQRLWGALKGVTRCVFGAKEEV